MGLRRGRRARQGTANPSLLDRDDDRSPVALGGTSAYLPPAFPSRSQDFAAIVRPSAASYNADHAH